MKYFFFLALAAAFWGLNFHLAKLMLQESTAIEAGFWRYALGAGTL